MVMITCAYTAPINPPDVTPVLSKATVFAGLQLKVRHAEKFVPILVACEVLHADGNVVTREVVFKEGTGPPGKVKEVCTEYRPTKVQFAQVDGTVHTNIISDGPSGKPEDSFLTYSFEYKHDVEEGSAQAEALLARHKITAQTAVDKTIETIRRMVKDGQLKTEG